MFSWMEDEFAIWPVGVFGSGPSCSPRSSKLIFGKALSPGNWKFPADVSPLLRRYATRNSFSRVGEKVWNSDTETLLFVVGLGSKNAGSAALASTPALLS